MSTLPKTSWIPYNHKNSLKGPKNAANAPKKAKYQKDGNKNSYKMKFIHQYEENPQTFPDSIQSPKAA